jgi:8-oxo-dGTP diphosphatase
MKEKRQVVILIPHYIANDEIFVFMQKRSPDMKSLPNLFGFWGGGIEQGETPEQALVREAREELGIELNLAEAEFFNHYETLSLMDVFLYKVERDWEKTVSVGEGEYGQWFTTVEATQRNDIIFQDKMVLVDLERKLLNKLIR